MLQILLRPGAALLRAGWLIIIYAFCRAAQPAFAADEFDWGFLASRQTDAFGCTRLRIMGPFFESAASRESNTLWGLRPFYVGTHNRVTDWRTGDSLWPVYSSRRLHNKFEARLLLTYYEDYDTTDPNSKYHLWVLPFYFQGRSDRTNRYLALFPLGGRIYDFLGRDKIEFALFPLLMRSELKSIKTRNFLWPVFSRTEGDDIRRARVFPIIGHNHQRDYFDKDFLLWPIWNHGIYRRPGYAGEAYILWPFYGRYDMENQQTWYVVPPLFRYTRAQRLNVFNCPYPFIQTSSGEINKFYVWPLWGSKLLPGEQYTFFLWPFGARQIKARPEGTRRVFRLSPFVYTEWLRPDDLGRTNRAGANARFVKVWPLLRYERQGGSKRLQILDLWPLKNSRGVDRCWSPFWSFYTRTYTTNACDDEFLWGLYRHRRRGADVCYASLFPVFTWSRDDRKIQTREWSLLRGLVGYRREDEQRTLRLLWFIKIGI